MPLAFVMINAEIGYEDRILQNVRTLPNVKEAFKVYGVYDVVVKVEAASVDQVKATVMDKIRSLEGIKSTLTMLAMQ